MARHSRKHSRRTQHWSHPIRSLSESNWLVVLVAQVLAAVIEMLIEHLLRVPPVGSP